MGDMKETQEAVFLNLNEQKEEAIMEKYSEMEKDLKSAKQKITDDVEYRYLNNYYSTSQRNMNEIVVNLKESLIDVVSGHVVSHDLRQKQIEDIEKMMEKIHDCVDECTKTRT